MRPRIEIYNLNKRYRLNEGFIRNVIKKVSGQLERPLTMHLEVIFLSDPAIKKLNKRYRKRNRTTDVLAFKMDSTGFRTDAGLGEIFISTDTASKNAKAFGTSFEREIVLYVIHGLLHLVGFNDESRKDKVVMSKKEWEILNNLWQAEKLSKVSMPR